MSQFIPKKFVLKEMTEQRIRRSHIEKLMKTELEPIKEMIERDEPGVIQKLKALGLTTSHIGALLNKWIYEASKAELNKGKAS